MTASRQTRISLVGPSGAGKSTAALFLQCLVPTAVVVSVAQPLRDIEDRFYEILGKPRPYERISQDGRLLQEIREILLARDSEVLERRFSASIASAASSSLIINADCRKAMQSVLLSLNFRFVFIESRQARLRSDETRARTTQSEHDEVIGKHECEFILKNHGDLEDLLAEARDLLGRVASERK